MNYFLKDIIEIYPLADYVEFPELSDFLTTERITVLENSGFYNESKILARIERKYKYNEIGTSDVSQFYDMLNQLIEENFSEYLMNLITIADDYSIQNVDTRDITFTHVNDTESTNLSIVSETPGNRLNIENIKSGTSADGVEYNTNMGGNYTDTTSQESTSAVNTTQSNIEAQIVVNDHVQKALNKFVDSLSSAFSIVANEYYESEC